MMINNSERVDFTYVFGGWFGRCFGDFYRSAIGLLEKYGAGIYLFEKDREIKERGEEESLFCHWDEFIFPLPHIYN
jgi:hypothetical protein